MRMSSGGHQASRYVCLKKKLKHHKAVMPTQRRNEGGQGGHISRGANLRWGAELLLEAPKSPNNVTSTFFNTVKLPSKELRLDHGGAKLRSWGRQTSTMGGAGSTTEVPNLFFAPGAI